jgi:acyl-coenzyme A synthetase/AMP-(fatty) acid ligase
MRCLRSSNQGLYLGTVAERAAVKHGGTMLTLDHDLDILPGAGRQLTVSQLATHIDDFGARLWACGVRPGTQVVIHKSSNFDIYLLASAAARIGAVPVMLSPALPGKSVVALLGRLHRPYLVTDAAKLDGPLAGVELGGISSAVVLAAGLRPDVISLEELAGSPDRRPICRNVDEPALITHTSGTTGLPKLVVHSARTLHGRFRPQRRLMSLIRKRETVAVHVSYVHSRMYLAMAVLLPRAMPLVIMSNGEPEQVADLFARTRPGFLETHPNSFVDWEPLADDERQPLSNVKYFSTTFDAIHPGTMDRLLHASKRRFPFFFQIYGQSECGPLVGRAYTRRNAHKVDGRCLGYAMPGISKFRIVSRDGKQPSRTSPGFIEVFTPGRAVTYYGEQARFAEQLRGSWWRSGDVGYRSRFGCLHLLDREIDVIPTVYSTLAVEDTVLSRLAEITEMVLVQGPNGEPLPVVCTRQDLPLDMERWRSAVVDFPQLTSPIQLPLGELPRTATMKVQRLELARQLREREQHHA